MDQSEEYAAQRLSEIQLDPAQESHKRAYENINIAGSIHQVRADPSMIKEKGDVSDRGAIPMNEYMDCSQAQPQLWKDAPEFTDAEKKAHQKLVGHYLSKKVGYVSREEYLNEKENDWNTKRFKRTSPKYPITSTDSGNFDADGREVHYDTYGKSYIIIEYSSEAHPAKPGDRDFCRKMTLFEDAQMKVDGDRQDSYGDPKENFRKIAALWSAILDRTITPEQVVLCMSALKLSRLSHKPDHQDSMVDLCGYMEILSRL